MKRFALLALTVLLGQAAIAEATISFSVDGLGRADTTADIDLTYAAIDGESAVMTVQVENTSDVGSRLVGFAFNLPTFGGVFATIAGASDGSNPVALAQPTGWAMPEGSATYESGWYGMYELDGIKTPGQAGDFDFGVLNTDNPSAFLSGGVGNGPNIVNKGDDDNATTFTLNIGGTGLDGFADPEFETMFFNELSDGGDQLNFAVRFEGYRRLGRPDKDGTIIASAPMPPAVVLCAIGLLGVGILRKRLLPNRAE